MRDGMALSLHAKGREREIVLSTCYSERGIPLGRRRVSGRYHGLRRVHVSQLLPERCIRSRKPVDRRLTFGIFTEKSILRAAILINSRNANYIP